MVKDNYIKHYYQEKDIRNGYFLITLITVRGVTRRSRTLGTNTCGQ
jgi:hypothetical protein